MHFRLLIVVCLLLLGARVVTAQSDLPADRLLFVEDNTIYTIAPDASSRQMIFMPDGDYQVRWPSWSPDGSQIIFSANRDEIEGRRQYDLFLMNADGTGMRSLGNTPTTDYHPRFSPDGSKIVYESWVYIEPLWRSNIAVINADGSGAALLTDDNQYDTAPSWSPDGSQIVFASLRAELDRAFNRGLKLFIMNADGANIRQLTDGDVPADSQPMFSPDGSLIAFASWRTARTQIYLIKPDGTGLRRITHEPIGAFYPSWSADGAFLSFMSNRPDDNSIGNIRLIRVSTGEIFTVTDTALNQDYTTFSPHIQD